MRRNRRGYASVSPLGSPESAHIPWADGPTSHQPADGPIITARDMGRDVRRPVAKLGRTPPHADRCTSKQHFNGAGTPKHRRESETRMNLSCSRVQQRLQIIDATNGLPARNSLGCGALIRPPLHYCLQSLHVSTGGSSGAMTPRASFSAMGGTPRSAIGGTPRSKAWVRLQDIWGRKHSLCSFEI